MVERDDGRRLLRLNEGVAVHSIWRRDTVLTGGVWDAFLALPPLLDRPLRRVAILGNAGGTTARALGRFYPDARVDGVELDPAVSRAGREYFGMEDNPNLTVYDADARPFLRRTDERYDLIIVDAYHQPYVPFYLATREFFRLARERLAPGGIVALNVASVPGDDSLLDGIAGTLTHEFDSVAVWPALRFNKILLAFDEPDTVVASALADVAPELRPLVRLLVRQLRPVTTKAKRPVDRRPRAGRVGDRPDDRRVRRARRRARRGLPADATAAMRLLRADGRLIRVGHRGAARLAPENTLRSFEAALEHGVDAIEFDVLDAGPGPLVLGHSLAELGPEPATLDDALDFLAGRDVALHVDLKLTTRLDELAAALDRHGVADRAVVSSFHLPSLQAIAAHAPQLPIGFTYPEDRYGVSKRRALKPAIRLGTLALRRAIVTRIPAMIARAGARALMLQHAVVSPAAVARAHAAGAAVWAWTVDDSTSSSSTRRVDAVYKRSSSVCAGVDRSDPSREDPEARAGKIFSGVATLAP